MFFFGLKKFHTIFQLYPKYAKLPYYTMIINKKYLNKYLNKLLHTYSCFIFLGLKKDDKN